MRVELLTYTPNPELLVATAAKNCYSSSTVGELMDKQTDESVEKFISHLNSIGHQTPLEHASFTFAIEGVSRSLLAQLTRHRIASFSVQSQRFVGMEDFDYVAPETIKSNPNALRIFDEAMDRDREAYKKLHAVLLSSILRKAYPDAIPYDSSTYYYLALDSYMDKQDEDTRAKYKKVRNAADKSANEDARAVLPNACTTRVIMTQNARELQHFFALRCCNRAQSEIRELADEMLILCKSVAPKLFENAGAPCLRGACPEGKMSCGHARSKEEYGCK